MCEFGLDVGGKGARVGDVVGELDVVEFLAGGSREGDLSGEEEVGDAAEGVDVGAAVELAVGAELLGCHVHGATDGMGGGQDGGEVLGDAEVADDDAGAGLSEELVAGEAVLGVVLGLLAEDHEVVGLEVAVEVALLVDVGESADDAAEDAEDDEFGERAVALEERPCGQASGNVLHDEEQSVVGGDDVVAVEDIGMAEEGHRVGLVLEVGGLCGGLVDVAADDLDGDMAAEALLERQVDGAHPTAAQNGQKAVSGQVHLALRQAQRLARQRSVRAGQHLGARSRLGGSCRVGGRRRRLAALLAGVCGFSVLHVVLGSLMAESDAVTVYFTIFCRRFQYLNGPLKLYYATLCDFFHFGVV